MAVQHARRMTLDSIPNSSPKETEQFAALQEGAPSPVPFQSASLPRQKKKKNPERSNFLLLGYPFKSSVLSHQVISFLFFFKSVFNLQMSQGPSMGRVTLGWLLERGTVLLRQVGQARELSGVISCSEWLRGRLRERRRPVISQGVGER